MCSENGAIGNPEYGAVPEWRLWEMLVEDFNLCGQLLSERYGEMHRPAKVALEELR